MLFLAKSFIGLTTVSTASIAPNNKLKTPNPNLKAPRA
jgi:hypothetical protein